MNASELARAIQAAFPSAKIEEQRLDSGVIWISIWLGGKFVSIECSPRLGFGVSLVADGDPGLTGHDRVLATPLDVLENVREILGPN